MEIVNRKNSLSKNIQILEQMLLFTKRKHKKGVKQAMLSSEEGTSLGHLEIEASNLLAFKALPGLEPV